MNRLIVIKEPDEVWDLLQAGDLDDYDLKLEIKSINTRKTEKLEKQLNRYKSSCGCEVGALFLYSAIIVLLVRAGLSGDFTLESITFQGIMKFIALLLFAAIIGKITGKITYRFLFRKTVYRIIESAGTCKTDSTIRPKARKR